MSSRKDKSITSKPAVVARSIAVSRLIATSPIDTALTDEARKAAKGFKRIKPTFCSGRRMTKEEFRAASANPI